MIDTRLRGRRDMRQSVFDNLDSAHDNGYFGPWRNGATAEDIAQDMALYATDHNGNSYTQDITPYVREWLHRCNLPVWSPEEWNAEQSK